MNFKHRLSATSIILLSSFLYTAIPARATSVTPEIPSNSNLQSNCQLKYGWTLVPPYVIGESTEPSGHLIDLVKWIAEEVNCKLKFIKMPWEDNLSAIKLGTVDLVGRSRFTLQRAEWAYFSDAYAQEVMVLHVRANSSAQYNYVQLDELMSQGFRIGILKGAYYGKENENIFKIPSYQKQILSFDSASDLPSALANQKIDGFFEALFTIDNHIMESKKHLQVEEYPMEIVTGDIYFMLSKKSIRPEFVEDFNSALQRVQQSKEYKNHPYWSHKN